MYIHGQQLLLYIYIVYSLYVTMYYPFGDQKHGFRETKFKFFFGYQESLDDVVLLYIPRLQKSLFFNIGNGYLIAAGQNYSQPQQGFE